MKKMTLIVALATALCMLVPSGLFASSHREAPITALDRTADITDWYAFVSYDHPDRVTMILNVDPFLEPSNGPNYFPFDPNVLYEMKVDNNQDGVEDITFQFRFSTQIRQPDLFTGFMGGIAGLPPITALDGPGSEGLNLRLYSRFLPTSVPERCRNMNHSSAREFTNWEAECGCLPEPLTIHSSSTSARLLIR